MVWRQLKHHWSVLASYYQGCIRIYVKKVITFKHYHCVCIFIESLWKNERLFWIPDYTFEIDLVEIWFIFLNRSVYLLNNLFQGFFLFLVSPKVDMVWIINYLHVSVKSQTHSYRYSLSIINVTKCICNATYIQGQRLIWKTVYAEKINLLLT